MKPVPPSLRVASQMLLSAAALACSRAPDPVSFSAQVKPLLDAHCVECHVPGQGSPATPFCTGAYLRSASLYASSAVRASSARTTSRRI